MSSGIQYHRLEFRDVEAEQFKEVLDRANLEHTIIGGRRGRAEIEQFHGPAFSLDRGHYAFPVVARGQFAPGKICIGIASASASRLGSTALRPVVVTSNSTTKGQISSTGPGRGATGQG